MPTSGLTLVDVINSIRKHRSIIIIVTIVSAVAGALFYVAGPKRFEAKTEFVVRNPLYSDRNNLYNYETKFIDYFANEDDVDRVILMANSEMVQGQVIKNLDLAKAYSIDATNRKGEHELGRRFYKNFNITRTEYKDLILSYVDTDPERAAKVANECVHVLEQAYGGFYRDMRVGMTQSIQDKIHEEDSSIDALTDSLVVLRDRYHLYDIISPSRYNLMLGSIKESGQAGLARGVETIQNYESLKDQLVSDRAKQTTIINQFETGNKEDQLPVIKVVTVAKPPVGPKGLGGMYTVLACAFVGIFFSTMLMSFADFYLAKPARR